jgi:hypothetical protein
MSTHNENTKRVKLAATLPPAMGSEDSLPFATAIERYAAYLKEEGYGRELDSLHTPPAGGVKPTFEVFPRPTKPDSLGADADEVKV